MKEFFLYGKYNNPNNLFLHNNNECILNYLGDPNYEFKYGNIVDSEFIGKALNGVECVIVLSGLVGDPITKKYPEESTLINDNYQVMREKEK